MDINNVTLTGRLCFNPELRYTQSGKAVCNITVAVGRMKKEESDFITCIAWDKTAEIIGEYCRKGSQVGIVGRITTGSFEDKDGNKKYKTEINISRLQLLGSKKDGEKNNNKDGEEIENPSDSYFPF